MKRLQKEERLEAWVIRARKYGAFFYLMNQLDLRRKRRVVSWPGASL